MSNLFRRWLPDVQHVLAWQKELCKRLNLTGKIRIASEGMNATVAGTLEATHSYMTATMQHPFFNEMKLEDFKVQRAQQERVCSDTGMFCIILLLF